MTEITCISPIDGRVVVRRAVSSEAQIEAALTAARRAQVEWAKVSLAERGRIMLAALAQLEAMNADVVPELAHQMGRPIRYGGELRSVTERSEEHTSELQSR